MTLEELAMQGKNSIYDSLAASIPSKLIDLRKEHLKQSLAGFAQSEHRLEFVARIHGIDFVNDSGSTTVNGTWFALESMNKDVVWITGSMSKSSDYTRLFELIQSKVKAIICLGVDNSHTINALSSRVPEIYDTHTAEHAVYTAYSICKDGDTVLFSPTCGEQGLFKSIEDRGNSFKQAVRSL